MRKKGAALGTIIGIAIASLLLAVIFLAFFGKGVLPKVAEAAGKMADRFLGERISDKDIPGIEIDKEVNNYYDNLVYTLKSSGGNSCTLELTAPKDFKDLEIHLSETESGLFLRIMDGEGNLAKSTTLSGKTPCVVGMGTAAKNFYDYYLAEGSATLCLLSDQSQCPKEYSQAAIITKEESIYVGNNKLRNSNLLYRTKDGNTCFIPINSDLGSGECGINEGFLDDDCEKKLAKLERC